jgi:hypothetical protein
MRVPRCGHYVGDASHGRWHCDITETLHRVVDRSR